MCTHQTSCVVSSQKENVLKQNTATSQLAYPLLRCNPFGKEKPDRNETSSDPQSTSLFHLDSISDCEKGNSNDFECPKSKYFPTEEMMEDHSKSESVNPSDKCFKGLPEEQGVDA